jgi:hypothetical protein
LAVCPSCEADRAARVASKAAVRSGVQRLEPDLGFEHALRRRLREEAKPKRFRGLAQLAMAASVLVALFAGWSLVRSSQPTPPGNERAEQEERIEGLFRLVSTTNRIGLGDHLHCAHFRKFAAARPSFEEMVEKLGPEYQDLLMIAKRAAPEGFRVALAHRCKYRDRPFVHLVLRRDEELISVVLTGRQPEESFELDGLAPAFHAEGLDVYEQSAEQFQISSFETSRHLAYVISNLDGAANRAIATTLLPELEAFLAQREG